MIEDSFFGDATDRMEKAYGAFVDELAGLRTGRVSSKLVEDIQVDTYGTKMKIKELATINIPEPQMLVIQPWDKTQIQAIDRAIRVSDLNLSPVADGAILRIPIPTLNEDRRKELSKILSKKAEEARIAVRNIRRDKMEELGKLRKARTAGEDEEKRGKEQVQKITDAAISNIDVMLKSKTEEIEKI